MEHRKIEKSQNGATFLKTKVEKLRKWKSRKFWKMQQIYKNREMETSRDGKIEKPEIRKMWKSKI